MSQLLTFSSFRNTGSRFFLRIPVWTQVPVSETVPVLFPLLAFLRCLPVILCLLCMLFLQPLKLAFADFFA